MLDISTQKVAEIILLARDAHRLEGEFDGLIAAMNPEEQASLVTIMWIGRGTFSPAEMGVAMATAMEGASIPTADYLRGTPHLADHLIAGLEALGEDSAPALSELMRY